MEGVLKKGHRCDVCVDVVKGTSKDKHPLNSLTTFL